MLRMCALGASAVIMASAGHASVLTNWNLIVRDNLTTNQEVEGRAAVGGNLIVSSAQFGTRLQPRGNFTTTDVLLVGGNVQGGNVQMEAGRLRVGGTVSGNINFNGGGGPTIVSGSTQSTVLGLFSQAAGISSTLAGLAPTGTVSFPVSQPAGVVFNAVPGSNGVAVFQINGSQLFGNGLVQQMDINFNGATSVIINVLGTSINHNAGNQVGNFNNDANRTRILWNFVNATSVNVDRLLNGAVLAPNAHLSNSTVIAGSVVAKSFNQQGEVHLPTYTGFIPAPGVVGVLAGAGLVAARRRRVA